MSLILDALRRAERARDKDLTRRISEAEAPRLRIQRRNWIPWTALGVVAALVAVVLWPRPAPQPVPPALVELPVDAAPQPAPQPAATINPRGSSLSDIAVPEQPVDAPPQRQLAPMLQALPATQRAAIPAVSVDAHFWSEDPTRRFVILDMRRVRAGEEVRPGLRVVAIEADSVELDWQGTRFRLPAR